MNRDLPENFGLAIPPHSIEAEQSLLGALLLDNSAYERVLDLVGEKDFYRLDHQLIFRQIARQIDSCRPADIVTIGEALDKDVDKAGGVGYLSTLMQNSPGSANARRYAEIVADRSKKRALILLCAEVSSNAYGPAALPAADMVDKASEQIFALGMRTGTHTAAPFRSLLARVMEGIDQRFHTDNQTITGVATGFIDLDDITAGFQRGDLIIIAGRPSMGKTALAMNIVEEVSVVQGLPSLVLSLEMSDVQLTQRMLGSSARINQHALRTGKLSDESWSKLSRTMGKLHEAPIIIEETFDLNPATLRAKARRAHRETGGLGLIVVDYLQLMEASGDGRNDQITEITRGLKKIAKELDVPVIALSQLNRALEKRPNKRPTMADLRDSGAIEQDADLICFLYRDEVYHTETANPGVCEVIIGKHRNGAIGTVYLTFIKEYTRFENRAASDLVHQAKAHPRSRAFDDSLQYRADIDG